MRRLAIFGAAALFVLAWVCTSHADTSANDNGAIRNRGDYTICLVHDGGDTTCTTWKGSGGSAYVTESSKDRDYVHLWQDVIGNASTGFSLAIGAADSTDNAMPIDVHAYRYLNLLIDPTITAGDTNTVVRLAFQFRECMNGNQDSTSLFPLYMYGQTYAGTTAGPDTSAAGHLFRGNAGLAWSGEYEVTIANNRGQVGNSISVNGRLFYYPNNIDIPLDTFFGRPVRFNNLSIRVRNMGYVATAQSATLTGHLHLLGFAQ